MRPRETKPSTKPKRARSSRSEVVKDFLGRTRGTKKGLLDWSCGAVLSEDCESGMYEAGRTCMDEPRRATVLEVSTVAGEKTRRAERETRRLPRVCIRRPEERSVMMATVGDLSSGSELNASTMSSFRLESKVDSWGFRNYTVDRINLIEINGVLGFVRISGFRVLGRTILKMKKGAR